MSNNCLICGNPTTELIDEQIKVTYDVCHNCDFISKQEQFILTGELEKDRYDQHNNADMEEEGYVNIFRNLIKLHVRPLKNVKKVLDFGSGPYPMFKKILNQEGYETDIYDLFYHKNDDYKSNMYDLITSTEVLEHVKNPLPTIEGLLEYIRPNGYLIIMTLFNKDTDNFLKWWYRRDPTHIVFFNMKTFAYIAKKLNLEILSHNDKNVVVFQKQ